LGVPLAGLLIDLFIWLNLSHSAQLLGVAWIAVGLVLYVVMRRAGTGADKPELQFESN
jgi:putrescine importer